MDVWHYKGSGRLRALTIDEDGGNLPVDLGPWLLIGSAILTDDGEDEQDAASLIVKHGYCCFKYPPAGTVDQSHAC